MEKVICSGADQQDYFKCKIRKCPHRKLHEPIKGRCGAKNFNGMDGWCNAPGTVSPLDGQEDGQLVCCMAPKELAIETKKSLDYYLASAIKERYKCNQDIEAAKKRYGDACKLVEDIKKEISK